MFVIIRERPLSNTIVIGPFDHEEDARAYGEKHCHGYLWRPVAMEAPAKG